MKNSKNKNERKDLYEVSQFNSIYFYFWLLHYESFSIVLQLSLSIRKKFLSKQGNYNKIQIDSIVVDK